MKITLYMVNWCKSRYKRKMYLIDIDNMSNKTIIKEQYKNADNLKLQKSLFEDYLTYIKLMNICIYRKNMECL